MLARRSFSVASRVRVASEQKTASVVDAVSKVVETHAKAATQKSAGILIPQPAICACAADGRSQGVGTGSTHFTYIKLLSPKAAP